MPFRLSVLMFVFAFAVAACSDDGTTTDTGSGNADAAATDTGTPAPDAGPGMDASTPDSGDTMDAAATGQPFGGTCSMDNDCMTDFVCRDFMQLGMVCTKTCTGNADCPAGSMGQRCNRMGICRP